MPVIAVTQSFRLVILFFFLLFPGIFPALGLDKAVALSSESEGCVHCWGCVPPLCSPRLSLSQQQERAGGPSCAYRAGSRCLVQGMWGTGIGMAMYFVHAWCDSLYLMPRSSFPAVFIRPTLHPWMCAVHRNLNCDCHNNILLLFLLAFRNMGLRLVT